MTQNLEVKLDLLVDSVLDQMASVIESATDVFTLPPILEDVEIKLGSRTSTYGSFLAVLEQLDVDAYGQLRLDVTQTLQEVEDSFMDEEFDYGELDEEDSL